ncbi:MAG: hypothetical protein ACE365_05995 [Gammaproteobacteria bacterium]
MAGSNRNSFDRDGFSPDRRSDEENQQYGNNYGTNYSSFYDSREERGSLISHGYDQEEDESKSCWSSICPAGVMDAWEDFTRKSSDQKSLFNFANSRFDRDQAIGQYIPQELDEDILEILRQQAIAENIVSADMDEAVVKEIIQNIWEQASITATEHYLRKADAMLAARKSTEDQDNLFTAWKGVSTAAVGIDVIFIYFMQFSVYLFLKAAYQAYTLDTDDNSFALTVLSGLAWALAVINTYTDLTLINPAENAQSLLALGSQIKRLFLGMFDGERTAPEFLETIGLLSVFTIGSTYFGMADNQFLQDALGVEAGETDYIIPYNATILFLAVVYYNGWSFMDSLFAMEDIFKVSNLKLPDFRGFAHILSDSTTWLMNTAIRGGSAYFIAMIYTSYFGCSESVAKTHAWTALVTAGLTSGLLARYVRSFGHKSVLPGSYYYPILQRFNETLNAVDFTPSPESLSMWKESIKRVFIAGTWAALGYAVGYSVSKDGSQAGLIAGVLGTLELFNELYIMWDLHVPAAFTQLRSKIQAGVEKQVGKLLDIEYRVIHENERLLNEDSIRLAFQDEKVEGQQQQQNNDDALERRWNTFVSWCPALRQLGRIGSYAGVMMVVIDTAFNMQLVADDQMDDGKVDYAAYRTWLPVILIMSIAVSMYSELPYVSKPLLENIPKANKWIYDKVSGLCGCGTTEEADLVGRLSSRDDSFGWANDESKDDLSNSSDSDFQQSDHGRLSSFDHGSQENKGLLSKLSSCFSSGKSSDVNDLASQPYSAMGYGNSANM